MTDVTIRGAGAFGLAVAWACAKRGAKVRVIDPDGVGAGASGGIVGALAPHVPEQWNAKKAFQFKALQMAEDWWAAVAEAGGGDPGYARSGRLQPLMDQPSVELAQARSNGAQELWEGYATWTVEEAPEDWAPVTETGLVIRDTLSARLHPRNACKALAAALWRKDIAVGTAGEDSGAVVHATGWRGMMELSDRLGRTVGNGVKGQAALLEYDARNLPQIFADGVHIVPHANGTVAIGSTSERDWTEEDTTDHQLSAIVAKARQAIPALNDAPILERWAGVRPRAKSRAPMLGTHPLHDGQFIANGGFKIGIGVAPLIGEVMADLILDGRDEIPEDFRPEASGA